jgi:hypothetical protein
METLADEEERRCGCLAVAKCWANGRFLVGPTKDKSRLRRVILSLPFFNGGESFTSSIN